MVYFYLLEVQMKKYKKRQKTDRFSVSKNRGANVVIFEEFAISLDADLLGDVGVKSAARSSHSTAGAYSRQRISIVDNNQRRLIISVRFKLNAL